jgi:hypothetical protein
MGAGALRRPTGLSARVLCLRLPSRVLWFAPRDIPRRASLVEEFEAFMLGGVDVVLDVERGERKIAGDAARGDPGVVDRPGASAEPPRVCLDLAPDGGGLEVARGDDDAGEECPETGSPLRAPAVQIGPLGQLTDRDERGRELLAGESTGEACR